MAPRAEGHRERVRFVAAVMSGLALVLALAAVVAVFIANRDARADRDRLEAVAVAIYHSEIASCRRVNLLRGEVNRRTAPLRALARVEVELLRTERHQEPRLSQKYAALQRLAETVSFRHVRLTDCARAFPIPTIGGGPK